jgi:AbrB family looped-hinge helix DNA binding protein
MPCRIVRVAVDTFRVSERGQMALPAEARHRWNLTTGGAVEVADLGDALLIVPAGRGGLRGIVRAAIDDAGGYETLAARVAEEEPELA